MLEITIKDTETGKVLNRTTKFAVIAASGDGGVHAMVEGRGSPTDIAAMAISLDGTRDTLLKNSDGAKALYLLKDMIGSVTQIVGLPVDGFSDR